MLESTRKWMLESTIINHSAKSNQLYVVVQERAYHNQRFLELYSQMINLGYFWAYSWIMLINNGCSLGYSYQLTYLEFTSDQIVPVISGEVSQMFSQILQGFKLLCYNSVEIMLPMDRYCIVGLFISETKSDRGNLVQQRFFETWYTRQKCSAKKFHLFYDVTNFLNKPLFLGLLTDQMSRNLTEVT